MDACPLHEAVTQSTVHGLQGLRVRLAFHLVDANGRFSLVVRRADAVDHR